MPQTPDATIDQASEDVSDTAVPTPGTTDSGPTDDPSNSAEKNSWRIVVANVKDIIADDMLRHCLDWASTVTELRAHLRDDCTADALTSGTRLRSQLARFGTSHLYPGWKGHEMRKLCHMMHEPESQRTTLLKWASEETNAQVKPSEQGHGQDSGDVETVKNGGEELSSLGHDCDFDFSRWDYVLQLASN